MIELLVTNNIILLWAGHYGCTTFQFSTSACSRIYDVKSGWSL